MYLTCNTTVNKSSVLSGTCTNVEGLPIEGLIPKTQHYMTYSGSLTQPGCKETVTWIIYNKPLSISENQVIFTVYNAFSLPTVIFSIFFLACNTL